jgi:4-hydroxybenzoyl-CoA reductase subunit beta
MMRLPSFTYRSPRTIREAADFLAAAPDTTMLVAGGTDLLPNMKRRQQTPRTLVGLRQIAELKAIKNGHPSTGLRAAGLTIGAGATLADLVRDPRVHRGYAGLWQAAAQVATPHLRNMGTIGGNLCLDTRCNYYDQNYEWRKAIDFCMKKDGGTCWVATSSPKCLAVSSTDTAPALIALGASVTLVSADGTRTLPVADLYRNDGIHYLTRRPTEIVASIQVPPHEGWRSTYWKLRRRGAFDFPVLSIAAAVKLARDGTVEDVRIVLGAVASRPLEAPDANRSLVGHELDDVAIARAADLAAQPARPMDNTDFALVWRKRVTRDFVTYALRELRGDDVRELRRGIARQELLGLR